MLNCSTHGILVVMGMTSRMSGSTSIRRAGRNDCHDAAVRRQRCLGGAVSAGSNDFDEAKFCRDNVAFKTTEGGRVTRQWPLEKLFVRKFLFIGTFTSAACLGRNDSSS